MLKRFVLLLSIALQLLIAGRCNAQISVVDSQTTLQLVQKLAGIGVTVSNATLTCRDTQCGSFHTISSNLGLADGIVLTSGKADRAVGSSSIFASTDLSAAGDASLNALVNSTTHDACKLEFDFIPIGDTVKFRYVFGSEEYPGYACTGFNDVFGFFISGPGFSSPKNIALIPNTTIPVAINSTSGVVGTSGGQLSTCQSMGTGSPFTQYYVNNASGTTVTYDGFTTILTAIAIVVPCSTYHLKLAVADAVDGAFDSGVFLEAGSFSSNALTVSTGANLQAPVPYCVRGCKKGQFLFKRQKVTNLPLTVRFQIAGTAVNGTDYSTIADSVVIPANDSIFVDTVTALTTASGTKTIKLYIYNPYACSSNPTILDSSQITIYDSIYAQIALPDTGVCPGGSIQLTTVGDTILRYRWAPPTGLNDTTLKSPIATPSVNTTYFLTATLTGSTCAPVHDDINISIYSPPNITAEPTNTTICNGSNGSFSLTATGQGLTYQWQVSSGAAFSNVTNTSPYSGVTTNTLNITAATTSLSGKTYRCVVSGTCTPKDTSQVVTLTISTLPAVTNSPIARTICEGENTSFSTAATGTSLTYQWQVNSGSGFTALSNNSVYSGVATNSLSLTNTPYSLNTYLYRCVVSGACNPADTSANALLTVYKKPEVTVDPVNTAVCPDSPASFSVTALATFITYQWQVNTGSGFTAIINNSTYSGATSNVLAISTAPSSMNGYQYRCIIAGYCDPRDTSAAATLKVDTIPDITSQPTDSTICLGNNASFAISATGTNVTYQWQVSTGAAYSNISSGSVYSGVNSNKLTLTVPPVTMSGYHYRCFVSGACKPNDTSSVATLTINTLPAIVIPPHDSTTCEGDPASFSVSATGTGITYQWQVNTGTGFTNVINNSIYAGATGNMLLVVPTSASMDNYRYRCIVTGTCSPAATSVEALLTVHTRPSITSQPHDSTVCDGSNATFKVVATGSSLTYQWQVNTGSSFVNISNNTTYSGATTASLGIAATTVAMSGYLYRCVVTGICTPIVPSSVVTLTVNSLPAITTSPHDSTICENDNASFSVAATGTALTYQWQVYNGSGGYTDITNNTTYSGATSNILLITAGSATMDNYLYRCVVSGVCTPSVTSQAARLTVFTRPAITTPPHDSTVCDGHAVSFNIVSTGTALTYQWQINTGSGFANVNNGGIYSGATASLLGISATTLAMSGYQYRCIVSGTCTPVVTSGSAVLTINVLPDVQLQPKDSTVCENDNATFSISAIGTALIYQWQVNSGSGYTDITNNTTYSGTTTNTLLVTSASAGMNDYSYRCVVSGTCSPNDTSLPGKLIVFTRPAITLQPHDSTICDSNSASFAIAATGTNITYQWQVNTGGGFTNISNNTTYSGAATNTLLISAAGLSMNGYTYKCVVIGTCTPPAVSSVVTLVVDTLPDIVSQPGDSTICEGDNATFGITAIGTSLTYQWQVNTGSGYANISNNTIYSGATTDILLITAGNAGMDNSLYRCLITGICVPPDTSQSAKLTVHTLPDITLQPHDSTICDGDNASFGITATGTAITYQWQVDTGSGFNDINNNTLYNGATTDTLSLTAANATMDNYNYRCIVTGICTPPAISAVAKLTVHTLPSITSQPLDSFICNGGDAAFAITATGTSITYQWQVNDGSGFANISDNSLYSGTSTNHLQIDSAIAPMDSFLYRCIVPGICTPPDTSAIAVLRVGTPPAIVQAPFATQICEGGDALFSLGATGTHLHYQWQVNTGSGYTNIFNGGVYTGANTNALLITGVTSAMSGYLYQCIISGDCPPSIVSGALTLSLTVFTKPSVTLQTTSSKICEGDNTSFTVGGTGTGITYHWQVDTGTGYFNIGNTAIYSGTGAPTLNITGATRNMSGYHYRCDIVGVCLPDAITTPVTLTVDTIPGVLVQPKDTTVCEETPAAFSLIAEGTNRTYQWQINTGTGFTNLANTGFYSGVNTGLLNISVAKQQMHGYQYRCIINGLCSPPDTSAIATLYTDTIPVITKQPIDSAICEGDNATFNISAIGTNIYYQWQLDGGTGFVNLGNNITFSGTNTNTLIVAGADKTMTNIKFRCIVSGTCQPPDTSSPAKLTVYVRPDITSQPQNKTICDGSNVSFAISSLGTNLNYQWQAGNGTGFANISNNSTYSGTTSNTLNIVAANTLNHNLYRCIVTGICTPNDTSLPAQLTVDTLPDITQQPKDSIICEGDNASFAIAAVGTGIAYQWQVNNGTGFISIGNSSVYSGTATKTLLITAGSATMNNYFYRCIVTGVCVPPDTSQQVRLTVNTLPNITQQPNNIAVCESFDASFKLTATGTAIVYQWQVNNGSGYTNVSNNTTYNGATSDLLHITAVPYSMNGYTYRCIVSGTCTPPDTSVAAALTIYTSPVITTEPVNTIACNSDNTILSLIATGTALTYQWQVDTGTGFLNVVNSIVYTGATTSSLNLNGTTLAMNGDKFRCIVGGTCAPPDTSLIVTLSVYAKPAITDQPIDTSICPEENAVFKIKATGSVLVYQWQVDNGTGYTDVNNSTLYAGATTTQLKITKASASMNGFHYRCIVKGYCNPPDTSDEVMLELYPKPQAGITPDGPTTLCRGDSVVLNGSPNTGVTYQWMFDNLIIPLAINNSFKAGDSGIYKLEVYNEHCHSTSDSLLLTANPLPKAQMEISGQPVICKDSSVLLLLKDINNTDVYQWRKDNNDITGANQPYYYVAEAGTYGVLVTNIYGCSTRSAYKHIEEDDVAPPYITTDNILLCTQNFENYQWYKDQEFITGATNACYLARENGVYNVKITNIRGCIRISNEYIVDKSVVIWPNPTSGVINILCGALSSIRLTDMNGKVILTVSGTKQIDISDVADGTYMLKLFDKNNNVIAAEQIIKTGR